MTIDSKVWARLPTDQYVYFFRKIYAGDKGVKQELVANFFTALYKECRRKGIKAEWDPTSATAINSIMSNINFNARRRPPNPSSKHSKKSYAPANDPGAIDGTGY